MFTSARNTMPDLDYVSILRSVYADRGAMLAGVFASAVMGGLTAYKADSLPLYAVALAFVIIGLIRYLDMRAFWRADIDSSDAAAAEHWENHAVIIGSTLAAVYGAWCFISMAIVQDPFAALASASISIAVMVGIVARNFGLDRLVTIQMVLVIVPLSLGYAVHGDIYHFVLAGLLGIMLSSFRKLAGDIRVILLSAVHGREEASRLATELDMAITTLEHGLCMLDEGGYISVTNERTAQIFSLLGLGDVKRQRFSTILVELAESAKLPRRDVFRLIDMIKQKASGKVVLPLPAGRDYEVTVSSRHKRTVLLFEDISERVATQKRINFMARHDTLTGLPNRTYFGEQTSDNLHTRQTIYGPHRAVSLMIIDIDDFKHVNDTFGHVIGDELLRQVAARLRQSAPADAILARLGGDEFVIYNAAIASDEQAKADAHAIQASFNAPFALKGITLNADVSVGLVTSSKLDDQLDDLMTKADLALYEAKAGGKAKSQMFHSQMNVNYHYRQRLKTDLRAAVANGELALAFQPLLDIGTRKVVSCEALARWQHAELGDIPPAVFIPLAEEMGLISAITTWVIERAATECSQWPGNVSVAVNISARDFRGLDLVAVIQSTLDRTGLDPARLEIEVTETAVIEERETAKLVLSALAAKGIAIALDDFGTGYSSLSYLNALPFTKLKIDRSFVADITTNPRSLRLLANVARLGRDLDLTVIAEGVETEDQLDIMVAHTQVQQVQGYFFSRPLPQRDVSELIGRLNALPLPSKRKRRYG
ncbi:MAG: putative bifunctional diguanylate cyclase/phosphodiesterase [Devosia sp.]